MRKSLFLKAHFPLRMFAYCSHDIEWDFNLIFVQKAFVIKYYRILRPMLDCIEMENFKNSVTFHYDYHITEKDRYFKPINT